MPLPLVALSHLTFPYDRSLHNVSVFPPNGIVGRTGTTKASYGQKLGILHPSSSLGLGFGFGRPCCRLSRQDLLPGIANTTKGSHLRKINTFLLGIVLSYFDTFSTVIPPKINVH